VFTLTKSLPAHPRNGQSIPTRRFPFELIADCVTRSVRSYLRDPAIDELMRAHGGLVTYAAIRKWYGEDGR
jgi:hypothetical protein